MKLIALTALLVCFANSAWGAGYQLRYQGAESMGTAFSSAGSYGESLSSIYYNPALFLLQDKDTSVAAELMLLNPTTAEFTSDTGQVSDDYTDAGISGAFYYGNKIDDDTAFTMAITTPWGTKSDYDESWDGRFHALETDLVTINLQAMISKRVSEKFMFSVGPQIQQMIGQLSRANFTPFGELTSDFDGDSLSVGGVLALTYMPSEKTTLGFNYTSRVKHKLRGDVSYSPEALATAIMLPDSDASTEIVTPDVLTLSASHKVSEKLIGHFSASYTNWSVFKELVFVTATGASTPIVQNWDDTYMLALGSTFHMNEKMALRGGVSYETGAVDNEFRTPRTQDADRIGLGLGASFGLGAIALDIGLNHIIYTGDIELDIADNPAPGTGVSGSYDNAATLLRVGVEYQF